MESTNDILADRDASEILTDSFEGMNSEFSSFEQLHISQRHIVWKAKRYNRWWILKGVPADADTEINRALLRKEFEIMMQLPAEGFPQAYSLEEVEGHGRCIIMEYIDGKTLSGWIMAKPSRRERRRVALDLVDIVARMHSCGVVSRDIKPSNILISKISGNPVLIDFDLADTTLHTAFKQPAGTPGYTSPEQASSFSPDRRNDIYSLAKVIIELKPPAIWRPVLHRCLGKIGRRLPDARQLSKRLLALERIPKTILFVLCLWMVVGSSLWLGHSQMKTITKVVAAPADTHTIDSLNNEINRLQDTLLRKQEAEEGLQQTIRKECAKAGGWVAKRWKEDIEDNPQAIGVDSPAFGEGIGRIAHGMDSIRRDLASRLDASLYQVVEADMNKTYIECYERWEKKTKGH